MRSHITVRSAHDPRNTDPYFIIWEHARRATEQFNADTGTHLALRPFQSVQRRGPMAEVPMQTISSLPSTQQYLSHLDAALDAVVDLAWLQHGDVVVPQPTLRITPRPPPPPQQPVSRVSWRRLLALLLVFGAVGYAGMLTTNAVVARARTAADSFGHMWQPQPQPQNPSDQGQGQGQGQSTHATPHVGVNNRVAMRAESEKIAAALASHEADSAAAESVDAESAPVRAQKREARPNPHIID